MNPSVLLRSTPRVVRASTLCSKSPSRLPCRASLHQITNPFCQRPRPSQHPKLRWPTRTQRRNATFRASATKLFKEYPFSVSLASAIILFGMGMLLYTNYIYRTYIIGDFAAYPEPVAAKLRRALYYTNISLEPKQAIKYYRQALTLAGELGMDPFSDEIMGVKIQLSALFEKMHQYQKAIDVLEIVRKDNLKWMDVLGEMEKNVESGKRTRVLGKTIGISVRLGEWYARDAIGDLEAAEERLVWAVTALLKEQKRRQDEGIKPGEGDWMSDEEIGGALESLATHYESRNQHYLAAPLFLQALSLCPPTSCHSVVLMNNLATSLAQQNPPPQPSSPSPSQTDALTSANQWAQKALSLASGIKPPDRTDECDVGCAVATINLGDFAQMAGETGEARKRWEEGKALSKAIGFAEGVAQAESSLRGLGKP